MPLNRFLSRGDPLAMIENPLSLINPLSALLAGVLTSLHCMGMCGPLACAMLGGKKESRTLTFGGYHIGKLISYSALGAIAGAIGSHFVSVLTETPMQLLSWSMAAFFLVMALGLDRHIVKLPLVGKFSRSLTRQAFRVSSNVRGLALGLATPFIPCGPLYIIVWVAALAGSAAGGATMLAFFGLGTIPGLLATQLGWDALTLRFSPQRLSNWRRGITLAACLILVIRSLADLSLDTLMSTGGICY